jgi:hypothetical protein
VRLMCRSAAPLNLFHTLLLTCSLYFVIAAISESDNSDGGHMSSLEFALSLIIALMMFLAFALTLATILLGNNKTKMAAVELFRGFIRGTTSRSTRPQNAPSDAKSYPDKVKQTGEEKV